MNGIENRMAIRWWAEELEKIGKADNLKIKFADNKMHDKAFVIDKQLLSVGSQNFHWSAWDFPSLTEYNIVSEDPEAIADFYREFEAEWEIGTPVTEE
jgi:phosphatidylserine/phosphatidylglycerophosphate/cardiolipin synthase-like enzyme